MKYFLSLPCGYFTDLLYKAIGVEPKQYSDKNYDYIPKLDISKELEDLKYRPRWDLAKRSFECPTTLFSDALALSANATTAMGIC